MSLLRLVERAFLCVYGCHTILLQLLQFDELLDAASESMLLVLHFVLDVSCLRVDLVQIHLVGGFHGRVIGYLGVLLLITHDGWSLLDVEGALHSRLFKKNMYSFNGYLDILTFVNESVPGLLLHQIHLIVEKVLDVLGIRFQPIMCMSVWRTSKCDLRVDCTDNRTTGCLARS